MTDGKAREMARDLVRGSIIEDAAAQFIAQILKHAHDERIEPLRDRAERLEAALNDLSLEMLRSDETQAFMQSRITTYREALSFYAKWGVENPRHDDLVRDDGGDIARAALKGDDHE